MKLYDVIVYDNRTMKVDSIKGKALPYKKAEQVENEVWNRLDDGRFVVEITPQGTFIRRGQKYA